jgi:hypothetical protein
MIKIETRLDSFYTEFESSRVELWATRLAHELWVLVPGLIKTSEETKRNIQQSSISITP